VSVREQRGCGRARQSLSAGVFPAGPRRLRSISPLSSPGSPPRADPRGKYAPPLPRPRCRVTVHTVKTTWCRPEQKCATLVDTWSESLHTPPQYRLISLPLDPLLHSTAFAVLNATVPLATTSRLSSRMKSLETCYYFVHGASIFTPLNSVVTSELHCVERRTGD